MKAHPLFRRVIALAVATLHLSRGHHTPLDELE